MLDTDAIYLLMKKNEKGSVLKCMIISFIMAFLGYGVLYIGGAPVFSMISAVSGMVVTKSSPSFVEQLDSIYKGPVESNRDLSQVKIPSYETCYGRISCEKVNLLAPLYWGDSEKVLKCGVGQYMGSSMPGFGGTILLSAHNCTYFEPLEHLKVGDKIKISTHYGDYEYTVTETKIVSSNYKEAYDLEQEGERLILYTCYPFGVLREDKGERYFVYAKP